jgi:ubiquitin carboxyl-terminal hydrolase 47
VLFDAIEKSLDENEPNFILDIFQGKTLSVVKCLECKTESTTNDQFSNLMLPVINIFEGIKNNSIEMALYNYLKPEKLVAPNLYKCSECKKEVEALRYTRIKQLPKYLFIQLGRFELDYNTFMRKKINDLVTFPLVLNMNTFLKYIILK